MKTLNKFRMYAQPLGEFDKRKCLVETDDYYWLLENMNDIAWKTYKESLNNSGDILNDFGLVEVYDNGSEDYFKCLFITA